MDEPEPPQQVRRITLPGQVAIEHSSGCVSDGELFDQSWIAHATAVKVIARLGMPTELLLIEVDRFSKSFILPRLGQTEVSSQMSDRFVKRQIPGKLDKANEVAATAATVAVEDVLGRVDVDGGMSFPVQGT